MVYDEQDFLNKIVLIIAMCTHLVSALMLGETLSQKWAKTMKDYELPLLKAVYYTIEVHNFDLQEKTTSTLK